jgi:hypothetical protein
MPKVTTEIEGIDPTFEPYIQEYRKIIGEDKYPKKFENLHMNFAEFKDEAVGRCWWLLNGYEIQIDRTWWDSYWTTPYAKQFLVYHELEHCIRKRMHSNRKGKIEHPVDFFEEVLFYMGIIDKPGYLYDGCPASLMHSHVMSNRCREKHYGYYLKEIRDWKPR